MKNKIKSLIKKLSRLGFSVKPKKYGYNDPVCDMDATSDLFKVDYQDKSYYFCSDHCREQFEKEPESYVIKQ